MALTSLTDFNGADGMGTSKAVLLGILISLCTAYIAQKAWQWYRLSHIPGPFWAGISRGWMLRHTLAGNMNLELKNVVDKYGEFWKWSQVLIIIPCSITFGCWPLN